MKSKAQVMMEYLFFLAVAILVILFMLNRRNSPVKAGVQEYINETQESLFNLLDNAE